MKNETILVATRDWETMNHFDKLGYKVFTYCGSYLINDDKFNYVEIINKEMTKSLISFIIFTYKKELKLLNMKHDNDILIYKKFEEVLIRLTKRTKDIFKHLKANNISFENAIKNDVELINNKIKWIKK